MKDMLLAYRSNSSHENNDDSFVSKELEKKEITVDIQHMSNSWHWNFRIIGLIIVSIWYFLYTIFSRILLIFTAIVIAIAMESLILYLEWKTKRRWLGILLAYLILLGLLLSGILVMVPFIVNQISDLVTVIISGAQHIEWLLKTNTLQWAIQSMRLYTYLQPFWVDLTEPKYMNYLQSLLQNNLSAIINFSSSYAKDAWQIVVSTVSGVIATFTQIGFVLTLSVLLSIEKIPFMKFVLRLCWDSQVARKKFTLLYQKLWFRLRTQILLWVYIGVTMWIALLILSLFWFDLVNKWSLSTIAALTELVPYIGPLIGWIPVVLLSTISYGVTWFLVATLTVFSVQRIENNILIPFLFKQNLWVSPVLIFLCMVLWWVTIGINGVILAIPITVIISILFSQTE